MKSLDITFDNDLLLKMQNAFDTFGGTFLPATKTAFQVSAQAVQADWQRWAMGGSLDGAEDIKNPSPKLKQSIKIQRKDDFEYTIGTESRYMEQIENGRDAQDMKLTYPFGKKSRVSSKDKIPYLIIPFRWGTPNQNGNARAHFKANVIPQSLYPIVKKMKSSVKNSETRLEENAEGIPIERATYDWGGRLTDKMGADSRSEGMVRMAGKGGYFTFRIISMNSPAASWWKKRVPANHVLEALKRQAEKRTAQLIEEGLKADFFVN